MKSFLFLMAALLASILPLSAADPEGFKTSSIILYQPDALLKARLGDVKDLAAYIKELQAACGESFAASKTPETLYIVVAVRPAKRSRVWFISSHPSPDAPRDEVRKKLESISPFEAKEGPIIFALAATLAGGDPSALDTTPPPLPAEWMKAAGDRKGPFTSDDLLDLVWPDKP